MSHGPSSSPSPPFSFFSSLSSSSSSSASSPPFPPLASRSPSPQAETALLFSKSAYAATSSASASSDSLSLHPSPSAASSSSSIPLPFPPVRQRSSHMADGSSITINSFVSPTSAGPFSSPTSSSSLLGLSFLPRWLPTLFRVRHSVSLLLGVVTVMLLLSAAVTSVGFSSLPLSSVESRTSSVHPSVSHNGERIILQTPPAAHGQCANSVQGKELLVDSNGVVCDRQDVDPDSGCCVSGLDKLSCRSCRHDLHCCHSYEYCISCCIGRQPVAALDSLQTFGQCAAVCRTSSASIKHGNVYKHSYHHCYDKLGPVALNASAFTSPAAPAPASASNSPSALSIVTAELGYSCEATCANRSLSCHDSLLSLVNNCDALNSHFPCRECELSDGGDQPAWVSDRAGADYPESRCLVQRPGVSGGLTCEGRHEKTQRLCVCLKEEAAEEGTLEVGHFDGDDDT